MKKSVEDRAADCVAAIRKNMPQGIGDYEHHDESLKRSIADAIRLALEDERE